MRVINRIFLSVALLGMGALATAQVPASKLRFPANPGNYQFNLNSKTPVVLLSAPRALVFSHTGRKTGVSTITAISIPNANQQFVGESKALKVNGPVASGKPILVTGKTLMQSSVNVDIVDDLGKSMVYKESEVKFNEEQNQLSIEVKLPAGIYTIQIPVTDGIASKTVIVQ